MLESVPAEPELAIGHSLGGVLLLEALSRLNPGRAIYEDPGWRIGPDREPAIAEFESRKRLTTAAIAAANPSWAAEVVQMRFDGFAQWDEVSARAFIEGYQDHTPAGPPDRPSLVVLADGSKFVAPETADRLRIAGWQVQVIPGTGHMVHLDDPAAFMAAVADQA